jgi:hypothetical protein
MKEVESTKLIYAERKEAATLAELKGQDDE